MPCFLGSALVRENLHPKHRMGLLGSRSKLVRSAKTSKQSEEQKPYEKTLFEDRSQAKRPIIKPSSQNPRPLLKKEKNLQTKITGKKKKTQKRCLTPKKTTTPPPQKKIKTLNPQQKPWFFIFCSCFAPEANTKLRLPRLQPLLLGCGHIDAEVGRWKRHIVLEESKWHGLVVWTPC